MTMSYLVASAQNSISFLFLRHPGLPPRYYKTICSETDMHVFLPHTRGLEYCGHLMNGQLRSKKKLFVDLL